MVAYPGNIGSITYGYAEIQATSGYPYEENTCGNNCPMVSGHMDLHSKQFWFPNTSAASNAEVDANTTYVGGVSQ